MARSQGIVAQRKEALRAERERELLEKERAFVRMPGEWPRWPLLPLKRRNGDVTASDFCGFLVDEGKPKVYIGYIFEANNLSEMDAVEYPDFDALLDVWKID